MEGVFLQTGSNLGDRIANLSSAAQQIEQACGQILRQSSVYQTAAWGKVDQPDFFNQVIEINTALSPEALLHTVLAIEQHMGRIRKEKWGERSIDIDILYYGYQIVEGATLSIPHKGIASRRFVLSPLNEIAPDFIHPVLLLSNEALLAACTDSLPVKRLP